MVRNQGPRGAAVKDTIMIAPGQTVKSLWVCALCSQPLQSYFDRTEHLPCASCFPGAATHMDVSPRRWGGNPNGYPIRIMFEKHIEHAVDTVTWRPIPCIDPTVDTRMAALLLAEGLEGCFVKPPHLHGHFVLAEGETLAERCPTGGCTWERSTPNGFFQTNRAPQPGNFREQKAARAERINELIAAGLIGPDFDLPKLRDLPPIQSDIATIPQFSMPAHFTSLNCWAVGCDLCEIKPPSLRFQLPDRSAFVGPGLASGLALEKMVAEQDRRSGAQRIDEAAKEAIRDELRGHPDPLDNFTWDFAPDPKAHRTAGDVRASVSKVPWPPPAKPTTWIKNPAPSDLLGRQARASVEGGCRLGCACPEHKPPREPWVPSVTDWDLLPDL